MVRFIKHLSLFQFVARCLLHLDCCNREASLSELLQSIILQLQLASLSRLFGRSLSRLFGQNLSRLFRTLLSNNHLYRQRVRCLLMRMLQTRILSTSIHILTMSRRRAMSKSLKKKYLHPFRLFRRFLDYLMSEWRNPKTTVRPETYPWRQMLWKYKRDLSH